MRFSNFIERPAISTRPYGDIPSPLLWHNADLLADTRGGGVDNGSISDKLSVWQKSPTP